MGAFGGRSKAFGVSVVTVRYIRLSRPCSPAAVKLFGGIPVVEATCRPTYGRVMTEDEEAAEPVAEESATLTMSVAEAAKRLGVKEGWYATQLRASKLPGHKMGNRWRLTEDDLQQALKLTCRPARVVPLDPAGLTPGSRRRLDRGR